MSRMRVSRARGAARTKPKPARSRSKSGAPRQPERQPGWLTQAAYARLRGVSKEAVSKAVRQGRIPVGPGGRVDPVAADTAWDRNTSPRPPAGRGAARGGPNGLPIAAAGPPVDLTEARTMHEYAKAQLAELELGERQGQLVAVADMRDAAFRATRSARDLILSVADRLGEVLAGVSDAGEVRWLLREELGRGLDELSTLELEPEAEAPAAAAGE